MKVRIITDRLPQPGFSIGSEVVLEEKTATSLIGMGFARVVSRDAEVAQAPDHEAQRRGPGRPKKD